MRRTRSRVRLAGVAARARLAAAWLAGCAASADPLSPGAGDLTAHFAEETPPVVGSGAEPAPGPDVSFELESFALGLRASHRALPPEGADVAVRWELRAPGGPASREPVAVVLAVDRSASMEEGEKLGRALRAAAVLVRSLGRDDWFGLVSFADDARLEVRLHKAVHPVFLLHRLTEIHAHGSTNLSGGLLEAYAQALDEHLPVGRRHVILLTDGAANLGETRRAVLADLARSQLGRGATLSTIGLGGDSDERLLTALATVGGGFYHPLRGPAEISDALRQELRSLREVAAQNVSMELAWSAAPGTPAPPPVRVDMADLYVGDAFAGAAMLGRPPDLDEGGAHRLDVTLVYDDPRAGRQRRTTALSLPVVADRTTIGPSVAEDVVRFARLRTLVGRIAEGARGVRLKENGAFLPEARDVTGWLRRWAERHGDQPLMNDVFLLHHFIEEMEDAQAGGGHSRPTERLGREPRESPDRASSEVEHLLHGHVH